MGKQQGDLEQMRTFKHSGKGPDVGDHVYWKDELGKERHGTIRHIGRLGNVCGELMECGDDTFIWSSWERAWDGTLRTRSQGGTLTFVYKKDLYENI